MRDVDKLKEKIELSLDNRQVVSLVIGVLVVLGIVFVLGVMIGKQLAGVNGQQSPQDVLAALDRQAVPDAGPGPTLTFQRDLTAPAPAVVAPVIKLPEPVKSVVKVPEPVKSVVKVPEPVKSVVKAPEQVEPPKPVIEAPAPTLDPKLASAFNAARKSPEAHPAAPAPTSGFTVQVMASQSKADTEQAMAKLRASGLAPYLVDAEIPGKGHWYRVRVGRFTSRNDADKYVKDLKRETGFTAFTTTAAENK